MATTQAPPLEPRRHLFMGMPLDCLTMEETLERVELLIDEGGPTQHVVLNAAKVVMASEDPELRAIIASCPLVNADGAGVVWGARRLDVPVPERVTGIDLFVALIERAAERGLRPYFLGARPQVVERVVAILRERHPQLEVAGYHHGYWLPEHEGDVVEDILASAPDLLFVAMPSPVKERWLAAHLDELRVPFAMGVGGAFDVVAGETRRAPAWMQGAGLEWLFRLAQEPRRMWRRYLVGNVRFARLVRQERRALYSRA